VSEGHGATQARVVGAAGAIGLATLASRVLGYVRDMVVAGAFGAGPVTDAFFVAFRIPNLLRRLLAEGALASAVIPVFADSLARGDPENFARTVRAVAGVGLAVLVATCSLGVLFAPAIVTVMTPGWAADPPLINLAVRLTRVMFPYLLLVGLAALATGVLNTHHRFFSAAIGPAVLNVGIVSCVWLLAGRLDPPVLALAVGVLVGGLGQLAVQLPELSRLGVPLIPSTEWRHPAVARIGRLLVPVVFGLAGVQLAALVNTLLASLLPPGSVSYLYYADRVMEFPLGVFGIALATAALPSMAEQAARADHLALRATLGFALRVALFVAVPAAAGLLALGEPIVRLLFVRGEFGPTAAAATTEALAAYAVGLPAFSATRIAAQTFYALGDTRTPVRLGLIALAANVGLALLLMGPLRHAGLALASSLSAYLNAAALYWLLRRRLGPLGSRQLLASLGRTALASAVLLAWCLLLSPRTDDAWRLAAWTLAVIAGGMAVYLAASALLRSPEAAALVAPLARRGRRLPPTLGG
jgi:putative peptidoglycan lipid II flippase